MSFEFIAYCSCGQQPPLNSIKSFDLMGKRYFSLVCSCGVRGPAAYNKLDAILKWNDLQKHLKQLKINGL
jgi:hypothetical protein